VTQLPHEESGYYAEDAAAESLREGPGTCIGPYELVRQIGEGGFGVVFLAEQEKPVARRVALKIIKLGMDTQQVVARFEQERQALAILDHPNIARVIDAGATETGRPYFVMDYVEGAPIGEYCDKQRLSIDERLALFEQVCVAVQHAHTKGIIHRDIKPSNVLIAQQDGRPQAKVIDFGIAKATSAKLSDQTVYTEEQQVIGTLQYMSPEQAEGSLDIDTRTDVYSLGVLLYELLTGSTPFDVKALRSVIFSDIQRMIREVDPPKPSTRLRESAAALVDIAARRRTEPARIGSILRGELDWIAMKALEKERERRYETADALALDVRRYLRGEAVAAAPPSRLYQLKKFVRRHRVTVTAAAAVAAALLIGVIGFAWLAQVAREQRDLARDAGLAESEQRKTADLQRALADEQRDRAVKAEAQTSRRAAELELVSNFQAAMLAQVDTAAAGRSLTADVTTKLAAALAETDLSASERAARLQEFTGLWGRVNATDAARDLIDRTILQPAAAAIDKQFQDQPLVAAQLRQTLATRYKELGLYDAALPLQQSALATRRSLLGNEHVDTLHSINDCGDVLQLRGEWPAAEELLREALDGLSRVVGNEHPDTILSIANVAMVLGAQGKAEEAEPYFREAVKLGRGVLGAEHDTTLTALSNYGNFLRGQNKLAEAEPLLRECYELSRRVRGPEHLRTLYAANSLGLVLVMRRKLDEGAEYWRETLAIGRRVLGEEHPDTLVFLANMGGLLLDLRKPDEAEPLYRETLEKFRRLLGPDHPNSIQSLRNLGIACSDLNLMDEAESLFREAFERSRRVLGAEHQQTRLAIQALAQALRKQGKTEEAAALTR
jgi:serine/threonine protein kinase